MRYVTPIQSYQRFRIGHKSTRCIWERRKTKIQSERIHLAERRKRPGRRKKTRTDVSSNADGLSLLGKPLDKCYLFFSSFCCKPLRVMVTRDARHLLLPGALYLFRWWCLFVVVRARIGRMLSSSGLISYRSSIVSGQEIRMRWSKLLLVS